MNANEITRLEPLIEYIARIPGIASAYLFGSSVKKGIDGGRDLDIALLFHPGRERSIDRLAVMTELSRIAGIDVDVVVLNDASPAFYHEVRRGGVLILDRDPTFRKIMEIRSRKLYDDFRHQHAIYMRGIRAKHGQ